MAWRCQEQWFTQLLFARFMPLVLGKCYRPAQMQLQNVWLNAVGWAHVLKSPPTKTPSTRIWRKGATYGREHWMSNASRLELLRFPEDVTLLCESQTKGIFNKPGPQKCFFSFGVLLQQKESEKKQSKNEREREEGRERVSEGERENMDVATQERIF